MKGSFVGFVGVVVIGCALMASAARGEDLTVVRDGQAQVSVVIPADATSAERLAAQELVDHVRLITGVTLPIGGSRSCAPEIRLGRAAGLRTDDLPPGAARIVADKTGIAIAGRDGKGDPLARTTEAGTLLGVYDFLENDLGVRWLWPGKLGTTTPKARTLTVAEQVRVARPMAFSEWRTDSESAADWAKKENADRFIADQRLWLRRHRYSCLGHLNKGHAYTDYFRRFGKDHPEYFNVLPDGSRIADPYYINGRSEFVSMCVTEPTLVTRIVEEWAHHPKADGILNGNENDTSGKCCCARCLAADATGDDAGRLARARQKFAARDAKWVQELGSTSARYAAFYKALLAEGTKVRPDCRVIGGIYANYAEPPPDGTELGDRVILRYCPPIMYPWTEKKIDDFKRIWEGWAKTGARLMMRPNFMLDGHNFPLVYYRWYVRCFDFCRDHGLDSMDSDSLTGQYGANGLTLYVVAAKNGRPTASLADLENDFFAAFGPAAEKIRAYMAHFERVSDRGGSAPLGTPENMEGGIWANFYTTAERLFTPEVMARGFALLDEAEKLAQDDPVARARIGFLRTGLTDCNLVLKTQRGAARIRKDGVEADFASAYRELKAFRAANEHLGYAARAYMNYLEGRLWPLHLGIVGPASRKLTGWTLQTEDDDKARPDDLNGYPRDAKGEYLKKSIQYRTTFELSAAAARASSHLLFAAVDGDPRVEINGQVVLKKNPLGGRLPDRTPFTVDVTGKLVAGKNVLTVRVDKKSGPRGIHRPVYLECAGCRVDQPTIVDPGPMKGPEVRVRPTPGGPRLFRDGKMVRPRMCFVRPGSGPIAITPEWTHHDLKHVPHRDMDTASIHLRFAQPVRPGDMQIRNMSFYTVENGKRVDVAGFDGAFADRAAFDKVWGVHPKENPYHFAVTNGVFTQWLKPWDKDPIRPMDYVIPSRRFKLRKGVEYHFVFDVRSDVLPQFMPNLWEVSRDGKHYDSLPMGDSTPLAETVRKAAAEGVDFVVFVPHFISWKESGDDFSGLDNVCAEIVAGNPRAVLIPRVTIEPDAAWLAAHPDHRMVTEDGEKLRMWSVSSRPGRAYALACLSRLVRHLNDTFPENFGGLQPVGQSTSEWFYEKSQFKMTGYDPATKEAWRQWLKAKGRANWATAEVPTPARRRTLAAGTCFLDPVTQVDCLDFNEFLQDEMSGWLGELLQTLRTLTGGKKLAYTFYGYVFEFLCNGPSPAMCGHYGLGKLLESHAKDIDIICAPISYINRGWTGTAVNMGAPESVERYGVMWFDENDSRTYLAKCDAAQSGPALCLQTKQKTLDVLRRDTTREILRNVGSWWMDLQGRGWYNDADLWKVISKTDEMERKVMARTRPFAPEVAVIVDEASVLRTGAKTVGETGVLVHFRRALSLVGVPFGQYIYSDVAKRELDAKLEVWLATWFADVPPPKEGVSRLFFQVPGAPTPKNLGPNDTVLPIKDIIASYEPEVLDALKPVGLYDIVKKAGVHMYLDREDVAKAVVWASDGYATVDAHEDCEISVNLPDGTRRPLKLRKGQCEVLTCEQGR